MAWVKRGGGSGVGPYDGGLPATHNPAEEHDLPGNREFREPSAAIPGPAKPVDGCGAHPSGEVATEQSPAAAYTATRWSDVLGNRVMLDLLARWVSSGNEPEMSPNLTKYY